MRYRKNHTWLLLPVLVLGLHLTGCSNNKIKLKRGASINASVQVTPGTMPLPCPAIAVQGAVNGNLIPAGTDQGLNASGSGTTSNTSTTTTSSSNTAKV